MQPKTLRGGLFGENAAAIGPAQYTGGQRQVASCRWAYPRAFGRIIKIGVADGGEKGGRRAVAEARRLRNASAASTWHGEQSRRVHFMPALLLLQGS